MPQKIFVAGHKGMVGSAILRALSLRGETNWVLRDHAELDLTNQAAVDDLMAREKPDLVYLAAAKVGGIWANSNQPVDFIRDNLLIQTLVLDAAFRHGVRRLLLLGSSCIYPRLAPQPMREEDLLTGALESTNEPYAVAKIAGIKLCESYNRQYGVSHGVDYRCLMPTNLYGPGDNYHPENSHVIAALMRRIHEAKTQQRDVVEVWGSGQPLREFLYVDDLALACLHVMDMPRHLYLQHTEPMRAHLNAGSGHEVSIATLAHLLCEVVGFQGRLVFDASKPDGTPRKLLDSSRLQATGWLARTDLRQGLQHTYADFLRHVHGAELQRPDGTDSGRTAARAQARPAE